MLTKLNSFFKKLTINNLNIRANELENQIFILHDGINELHVRASKLRSDAEKLNRELIKKRRVTDMKMCPYKL